MGVICSFLVFLCVFCVSFLQISSATQRGFNVCDLQGCNCTVKAAAWKVINCSLHEDEVVVFDISFIPKEAFELYIYGGREIKFDAKTFNALPALTLIQIKGTRKVVMEKKCFYNINASSLLIQIHSCDELIIKTGAFEYVQSSVSTEITNVQHVVIEQEAFSKLYNCSFQKIHKLSLFERSFDFKYQTTIGRHGPVTAISFDEVVIPKVPKEVFPKPLANIVFYNSHIGDLHTGSFKATEISSVVIFNTTLANIEKEAFADGTLIFDLKISKSKISSIRTKAIMAGISNFSITHSKIREIEPNAVISTAARVEFTGNEVSIFHSSGFVFNNWNRIIINDNTITHLHSNFIEATANADVERFSFKGNEIYTVDIGALSFLSHVPERGLIFDDNFFHETCGCNMSIWLEGVTNTSRGSKVAMDTSFCVVNELMSKCLSLPEGIINIQNFTEMVCSNFTKCEILEKKLVNTTSKIFISEKDGNQQKWLIVIIAVVGLLLIAIMASFVVLLMRSNSWLKDKCFPGNVQYNNDDLVVEDEGTIVTLDENEKLQIPEELTLEFLQILSKRLDDPVTHQEASEMIERLYEMFIVDDSYENNNRDEEAHLYEELGNLNLQIPPPPYEEAKEQNSRSILKLMEDKINVNGEEQIPNNVRPALVSEYSEPNDAAVHLYSEIKNKNSKHDSSNSIGSRSQLDGQSARFTSEPGPSTKF